LWIHSTALGLFGSACFRLHHFWPPKGVWGRVFCAAELVLVCHAYELECSIDLQGLIPSVSLGKVPSGFDVSTFSKRVESRGFAFEYESLSIESQGNTYCTNIVYRTEERLDLGICHEHEPPVSGLHLPIWDTWPLSTVSSLHCFGALHLKGIIESQTMTHRRSTARTLSLGGFPPSYSIGSGLGSPILSNELG
jgi:hypothetical protein